MPPEVMAPDIETDCATDAVVDGPYTLLTRASQRRYSQPNIATDTAATYASLPNVALHDERELA